MGGLVPSWEIEDQVEGREGKGTLESVTAQKPVGEGV